LDNRPPAKREALAILPFRPPDCFHCAIRRERAASADLQTPNVPTQDVTAKEDTVTGAQNQADEPATPRRPPPRLAQPRIPPVAQADLTAEQKAILEPFERRGRIDNVFTTMANHPQLARDWLTFAN
jgi:hypothetical protein